MKFKRLLIVAFSILFFSFTIIGATPDREIGKRSPIIIGEVIEVEKNEDEKALRITVKGYIKGNEVNEIEVIGIVNNETKIMNSNNDKKENIKIEKGDLVYMRVNEAMTKSNPPQTVVKRIFVTKNK